MAIIRQMGESHGRNEGHVVSEGVEEKVLRSYKVLQAPSACPSGRSSIKIMALERSTLLA